MGKKHWFEVIADTLKSRDVRLIAYVPDKVLVPLLDELLRDDFFTVINPTREEEAVGIVAGAWMAGRRGVVLMQTSGFATIANALASLAMPYQIPVPMIISERGTLGEFQIGQFMVYRAMQPLLNAMNIESYRLQALDTLEMIVGRSLDQAHKTQTPVALLLNPLLTARSEEEL